MRVAVVGNLCNTNALIAMHAAADVPNERFSAMTRLDQNRAQNQLARKAGVAIDQVENMLIWGNHSATQVPDFRNTTIGGKPAHEVITDHEWPQGRLLPPPSRRRRSHHRCPWLSSAASAANGLIDHVRDLVEVTPDGRWNSVCVPSTAATAWPRD